MQEITRQFVIFGNFKSVTFDDILKLSILKEKYSLTVNAMPDIIQIVQPIQFGVPPRIPESRPLLQSADKRISVFFGTERIHVEELDGSSEKYDDYNKMALDIICQVVNQFKLNVNRVALNGQLFNDDKDWMQKAFNRTFNKSNLYSDNSEEWQFRVGSKDYESTLGIEVYKITEYVRGVFRDNLNNNRVGVMANYDFNTKIQSDKFFNESEIIQFNKLAQKFRENFI